MQQKKLEDFLKDGRILIGSRAEFLFYATFKFYTKEGKINVQSSRGVKHLLALLYSELLRLEDEELARRAFQYADNVNVYGINQMNLTVFDKLVSQNSIEIYRNHIFICIECQQTMIPAGETLPGIYGRQAMGKSLPLALRNVLNMKPSLEAFQREILQP